jgi:hypothetical protein
LQIFGSGQQYLLAAPAGAASKPLFPLPKICKILFGGLYLKMREPFLNEMLQAFRKIPNRSGGAGRKGVKGERNSHAALAFRKNFVAN